MPTTKVEDIRDVVFGGHGSAGKTTLVDLILNKTGAVKTHGSVEEGTSICDFDPEEKSHKYTIEASIVHCDHGGKRFYLIDTPGYPDFIGQTIGAMRGVDTAAIVINVQVGIQVNTRCVFDEAGRAGLGRIIVINKMDAENVDFAALLGSIKQLWGNACVPLNVPVGHGGDFHGVVSTLSVPDDTAGALVDPHEIHDPLIESIIEVDEEVMERYFEGQSPLEQELSRLMTRAVAQGTLIPIVCCSGKTGVGVQQLLDAIALCCVPPGAIPRKATKDGEEIPLTADPSGPLVAQVFKTCIDPFVQKLSYVRVFSGTLKKDTTIAASSVRKGIKIGQLLQVQASETSPVDMPAPATSWPWPRWTSCTPGPAWVSTVCLTCSSPLRWSAWPSCPRAAATKPSCPGR